MKKEISPEMYNYLSPAALAFWIMSDGTSNQYGLTICTDSYSYPDVVRLLNILKIRYFLSRKGLVRGQTEGYYIYM